MEKKVRAEFLRTPNTVCQPDPRSRFFGIQHDAAPYGGKAFEGHYSAIAPITLHPGVPEEIVIQFETARNIYFYAWFVYRFYPVAESQAYTCLEFALRVRLEGEMVEAGLKKREFGFTLRKYLTYAVKRGYIRNEDFEVWREGVWRRARDRHCIESIKEMERLDLKEMAVDESKIEVKDEDKAIDYVAILLETIPRRRNHYAHGSNTLHKGVLGTFRIVSEIINKLWPDTALPG